MENVVEVTPASPPANLNDLENPESPEIRVTETPESSASSPGPRSSSPQTSEPRAPLIFQPFLPLPGGAHRSLPFSIDNILKPTFGRNNPLLQNPAFFYAAAAASAQQKLNLPERQRSPSSSSSSNGSLVKCEQKSPPSSPINHNNNQPVDLSSKNGSSEGSKNGSKKADDQEGVPPGMVRGPNGQLWPAWVFCTRYSDRPSSGKFLKSLLHN